MFRAKQQDSSLFANYLLFEIHSHNHMVSCTLPFVFVRARKEKHVEKLDSLRKQTQVRLKWKSGVSTEVFSISTGWGLETQYGLNEKWSKFSARETKRSTTQKKNNRFCTQPHILIKQKRLKELFSLFYYCCY